MNTTSSPLPALIRLLNLRHLRRQRVRTILSMLGVVIGVTTFIFGPAIAASIQDSLKLTTSDLSGKTEIELRSTESGFDTALIDKVRAMSGVQIAAPLSTSGGLMMGQSELLVFIGIDPTVDRFVRTYTLVQGEFLSKPNDLLLSEAYAHEKGIKLGDDVRLVSAGGLRHMTVVGTLSSNGVARLNSGDVLIMGLTDSLALRAANKVDSLSVIATSSVNTTDLASQLKATLPANVSVDRPADRLKSANDFMVVVNTMMLTISLMVLGIGSLLIYNTMAVSVSQRRAEIGIMRALGMTREQIIGMFTLEATVLGFIASILGVGIGFLMVKVGSNLPVIPQFSSEILSSKADISVPFWLLPVAFIAGVLISALAGYIPSRYAATIDPIEAMVAIRSETSSGRYPTRQLIAALVLMVALAGIRLVRFDDAIQAVMVANTGIMIAFAILLLMVAPVLMAPAKQLPKLMYRLLGITGLNAATNVVRRPKRVLVTAILITLAVGGGALVSGSNFGYSEMIYEWNTIENVGDLTVAGAGTDAFSPMIPLQNSVVDSIRTRQDVAGIITEKQISLKQHDINYLIRAMDIGEFRQLGGDFLWNEHINDDVYARLAATDKPSILVSTNILAISNGLIMGKSLTLDTPSGPVTFDILGSFLGKLETDRVKLIMDRTLYTKLWNDPSVDRAMITLKAGTDAQTIRRELLKQFVLSGAVTYSNDEVRQAFAKPIVSISTVSGLLSLLILVTVAAGIGSTMFVQILDRRREIGMLRAVGMLPHQIIMGVLLEVVLMVLIGIIIGVPAAYVMTSLQQVAMQQVMGIQFALKINEVCRTIFVVLIVGLLATYIPARSAGRINILEVMRYE